MKRPRPETIKFANKFVRIRNQIERKGVRIMRSAIASQYIDFMNKAKNMTPQSWPDIAIHTESIQQAFLKFYPMSSQLAVLQRGHLLSGKDAESDFYDNVFQGRLRDIVTAKAYSEKIKSITGTTKKRIDSTIQDLLDQASTEGWGIDKIQQGLVQSFSNEIKGNVIARARGIAQTEMISASNQAAAMAADSTRLEYRKFWSTSHLENTRDSHQQAEADSIQRGGLKKEELHSNGLLYPGDPNGSAEEVINCRCSELYEIV